MVQSGIAYAAGQLLAVVAPRTVLVVDAPTDWSLAGPLWELALDDAPVDEILDVLIRRGIRTAPSFAIVRVEDDAVRALVRGTVPVCFERVGEPVRLDATGATTWLEGLISGARRVLVGAVETNTSLPYLVSTGVVLVSGLALPCGPGEPEAGPSRGPGVTEPESAPEPDGGDSATEGEAFFSPPVPIPSSGGPFAPVGREPRVVDLTRSESRAPARASFSPAAEPRDSWALASKWGSPDRSAGLPRPELNGHVPAVLEPQAPESAESESGFGSPAPVAPDEAPARFEAPSPYRSPAAFQAPAPFTPADPGDRVSDDPGELHDLDPVESPAPDDYAPVPAAPEQLEPEAPEAHAFALPAGHDQHQDEYQDEHQHDQYQDDRHQQDEDDEGTDQPADAEAAHQVEAEPHADPAPDSFDDLLVEPAEDELPPSPSPADLPNFDPPVVALPLPAGGRGPAIPAQPRGFGGVPASWPPAAEASDHSELDHSELNHSELDRPDSGSEGSEGSEQSEQSEPQPASALFGGPAPEPDAEPDRPAPSADLPDSDQPPLGELPLRVRGRSLRPESSPMNGRSPVAGPPPVALPPLRDNHFPASPSFRDAPEPSEEQFAPVGASNEAAAPAGAGQQPDSGPESGSVLLPAFFRGARAARKSGPDEAPAAPAARETTDEPAASSSSPVPWALNGSAAAPSAWAPPARRPAFPERAGFNGGPPAMPGVLRPVTPSEGSSIGAPVEDEHDDRPTEHTPPPRATPAGGIEADQAPEALREPPRLLGVWCDAGHVTSPDRDECRVCGLAVPPQAPILVARPPLGVLIFDNGDRVEVDRPVVLGRDPKPVSSPDPETPVLHPVASATGQVSRTHAEIRAAGWDVVLTDLDAMNGTALTLPGESPVAIEPGVPMLITPGARVDLGGESGFVFEVEG